MQAWGEKGRKESWLMPRFLAVARGPFIVLRKGTADSLVARILILTKLALVRHLHEYSSRQFRL